MYNKRWVYRTTFCVLHTSAQTSYILKGRCRSKEVKQSICSYLGNACYACKILTCLHKSYIRLGGTLCIIFPLIFIRIAIETKVQAIGPNVLKLNVKLGNCFRFVQRAYNSFSNINDTHFLDGSYDLAKCIDHFLKTLLVE